MAQSSAFVGPPTYFELTGSRAFCVGNLSKACGEAFLLTEAGGAVAAYRAVRLMMRIVGVSEFRSGTGLS